MSLACACKRPIKRSAKCERMRIRVKNCEEDEMGTEKTKIGREGRSEEEKKKRKKKERKKTKADETRGILVCGHNRCLQPTIMIIAPES